MMSPWLLPLVGVSGLLVYRAWQHDAALRSGELMDVRDVLPEGEVELELRALGGRRYRLELQFEACLMVSPDHDFSARHIGSDSGVLPYRLRVEKTDGPILYERERSLQDLFGIASSARESTGTGGRQRWSSRHWGCVPLLDFQSSSLGRLRFEFSIRLNDDNARIEKAQLVLKEDVRRLRYSAALLDRISIDAQEERGWI